MHYYKRHFSVLMSLVLFFTLFLPINGEKKASASVNAPLTAHELVGNLNVNGIYYGTVQFRLVIQDPGSGVSVTRYSLDDGATWLTYTSPISFSEKKVYHILYQSVDIASNIETPKEVNFTIKKDNFPPETTLAVEGTQGQNGYYVGPVQISITGSDSHSKVDYSEYSLDSGQSWRHYNSPISVDQTNTVIYYRSVDVDGNVEKAKKTKIMIDGTPPKLPDFRVSPDEWSNSTFTVTIIDGEDEQSGTLKSQYRIGDSGDWLDYSQPFTVEGNGSVNIYARTVDFAGNSSEGAVYTLQFDKLPPTTPEIILSFMDWINDEVFVTIDGGSDAESSISGYEYRKGTETDWTEFVDSFTVKNEGITPIYARTIDLAGNPSAVTEGAVKIDLTPPSAPANLFKINQFGTSALIQWSPAIDNLSGIDHYEIYNGEELLGVTNDRKFQLDNLLPNQKNTITVVSVDIAGNMSNDSNPLIFFTSNISMSGYRDHSFAWNNQGQVWGWGSNNAGQLGDGTLTNRTSATRISALDGFLMISAGLTQNIGLRADGTVWTWGRDLNGTDIPLQSVSGLDHVVTIAAGLGHFIALKEDGTVWAWGNNTFGQLGTGTTNNSWTPVQVNGLSSVVSIAAGYYNSMALKDDGTVWAWGDNSRGILGFASATDYKEPTPRQVQGLNNIMQIDFSYLHGTALKQDGTVWTWGFNDNGQLGNGMTTDNPIPSQVQNLSNVVKISASYAHNLALTEEGKVWSWGDNGQGELGDGTIIQTRSVPVQAAHLEGIIDIEAAEFYSFAVKQDGSLWAWGVNSNGQLGAGDVIQHRTRTPVTGIDYPVDTLAPAAPANLSSTGVTATTVVLSWNEATDNHGIKDYLVYRGTNLIQSIPVDENSIDNVTGYTATGLSPGSTYKFTVKARDYANNISFASNEVVVATEAATPTKVSAGSDHTYTLKSDGSIWSWGSNSAGQLGDGTLFPSLSAVQAVNLYSITAISAGSSFGLGLKSDGTVWSWGDNSLGQLGNGSYTYQQYLPLKIENFNDVTAISAGHTHSLALKSDGTVWAWGSNFYGELGIGNNTTKYVPTRIPSLSNVKAISAGMFYSLAVKNDGSVWAWGSNMNGQLGNGTYQDTTTPVKVSNLTNITDISAGLYHALALKSDGSVWAWGDNTYGQLGDRTTVTRTIPTSAYSITGAKQVSAGMYHSIAKTDTNVYSWGYNNSGQLGNGNTYSSSTPVKVSNLSGVKDMDAGYSHNVVIEGTAVKTWGEGSSGQLGSGSSNPSSVPIIVQGLPSGHTASRKAVNSDTLLKNIAEQPEIMQGYVKGLVYPDGFIMPDFIAPTAPESVKVSRGDNDLVLKWKASRDNIGIKEYWVYVNENVVLKTGSNEGVKLPISKGEVMSITVRAVDEAGNISLSSMPVSP